MSTDLATFDIPRQFCPKCFTMLEATTNMQTHGGPQPGDFTCCVRCGALLTFAPDMQLEPCTLADVPSYVRAKFARLIMLIEERNRGKDISKL